MAGRALGDAGVRLALFVDRGEKLAVLQLDAVHRDVHPGDVDLVVLAVQQIVVVGDVTCRCRRCSGKKCRAGLCC